MTETEFHTPELRNAQVVIEKHVPKTKIIMTDDLGKLDDKLHYNSQGIMETDKLR